MESVTVVLALLLSVLVSGALGRLLPLPLPLIQIAIGVALALGPLPSTSLDPEIFFLVFLPPLLFLDGWRIPKRDLFRDGKTVLALALGLVVLTVLGIGTLIHVMIPGIPLAVAFALAAVLSPTDPIAVSSVAAQAPVPRPSHAHPRRRGPSQRRHRPRLPALRHRRRPDRNLLAAPGRHDLRLARAGRHRHRRRDHLPPHGRAGPPAPAHGGGSRPADPVQPAHALRRLSGRRACPRLRHPRRRRGRHRHDLCGDPGAQPGGHARPAHRRLGHGRPRGQRLDLRPPRRAAAGGPAGGRQTVRCGGRGLARRLDPGHHRRPDGHPLRLGLGLAPVRADEGAPERRPTRGADPAPRVRDHPSRA